MAEFDHILEANSSSKPAGFFRRLFGMKFLFISIAVHLLLGIVAAIWVVQNYNANRKLTFKAGPPSPNAPTRALEHKVQMAKKQNSMSAPPNKRIVSTGISKVTLPDMPALPKSANPPTKMAGAGGTNMGFAGDPMGAATTSPGGGPVTAFGFREAKTGTLIGTFYDLKQDRERKPTGMDPAKYAHLVQDFVKNGWSTGKLTEYFTAPNKLYAKEVFVPSILATEGPKAFGVEKDVEPKLWLVHYVGKVSPPESGTFNFVGGGDDVLYVRFNGKTVLDACYWNRGVSVLAKGEAFYDYHWPHTSPPFVKGEPLSVTAGQSYPMEVLIGEQPGGLLHFCLLMEQSGKKYTLDQYGNPVLPVFRLDQTQPKPAGKGAYPPFDPGGPVWSGDAKSSIFKTQAPGAQ